MLFVFITDALNITYIFRLLDCIVVSSVSHSTSRIYTHRLLLRRSVFLHYCDTTLTLFVACQRVSLILCVKPLLGL